LSQESELTAMLKMYFALSLLFLLAACASEAYTMEETPPPLLDITVFGIGRADAILITTNNHAVMIDAGENRHGMYLLEHLHKQEITHLDYLIITHFDSDHVGGAHTIVDNLPIGKVIVPDYTRESNHIMRFEQALANAEQEAYVLTSPMRFSLDDAEFYVNPAQLTAIGDNMSIVVSVSHGANDFLFTGDAEDRRLRELLAHDELMATDFDFLKVPRHGRYNRFSVPFIEAISPQYAVITGFHFLDSAKHPGERPADMRVIATLYTIGAEVFYTMRETFHLQCNGAEIKILDTTGFSYSE